MNPRPHVLLVEDDPPIQTLVELALDELPIELRCCETIADALQTLRSGPVQMLITDLTLPDGSGLELLEQLQRQPALRGSARLVVFSAGLHPEMQARLAALGVWRMISKPSPMQELAEAVSTGLWLGTEASGRSAAAVAPDAAIVASQFGGSQALFDEFRARSVAQFPRDLEAGDLALRQQDGPALQQLAHGLKDIARKLGLNAVARQARALEDACDDKLSVDWAEAMRLWRGLREQLQALA